MPATGHRLHVVLTDLGRSHRGVRAEVREFLGHAGVPPQRAGDVVLALSELVTNGCEAATGAAPVRVTVSVGATVVRIEVVNDRPVGSSDDPPIATVTMPGTDAARGRGLALVAALAVRLSIESNSVTTAVRADLLR